MLRDDTNVILEELRLTETTITILAWEVDFFL